MTTSWATDRRLGEKVDIKLIALQTKTLVGGVCTERKNNDV